jgi:hypothetical protein
MRRHRFNSEEKPAKMAQTFFLLDCHTGQPVCFSLTRLGGFDLCLNFLLSARR